MTGVSCPQCGTPVLDDARYCSRCGALLGSPAPIVPDAPTRPVWPPSAQSPEPTSMKAPAGWTMPPGPRTDVAAWPPAAGLARPPLPPAPVPPAWPGPTAARPLVPYATARSVRVLCGWIEAIAWLGAATLVASAFFALQARSAVVRFFDTPFNSLDRFRAFQDVVDAEDRSDTFLLVGVIVWVVLVVLLMILGFRMLKHARSMGAELRLGPGWAIGGWFIPFVNSVVPFLVMSDVYRVATSDASPPIGRAHRVERPSRWIWAWWLASVACTISTLFLENNPDSISSRSDWLAMYAGQAVFAGLMAVAALCLTRWVSNIRRFAGDAEAHPVFAGV